MSAPVDRLLRARQGRVLAVALGLAAMLAVAWLAGQRAERAALADLDRQARAALTIQSGALRAEMQRQSALPLALASDPEIATLLRGGPSRVSPTGSARASPRSRRRPAQR